MDGYDTKSEPTPDAPLCPNCGQTMRFVRAVPRLGALPELRTYECKPCGVSYTEAAEAEAYADTAPNEC